jgi:phospholipid transport system transporter-binding protein
MSNGARVTVKQDTLQVAGDINFDNVFLLYQESLPYLQQAERYHVDFAGVTSSNSAGIALIIEWVKFASLNHRTISFGGVSAGLRAIAKVGDVEKLIWPA